MSSDVPNQFKKNNMMYFPGIQELRGLLITLIVLSHASAFSVIYSKSIWGAAGVTGFFMISGFLTPEKVGKTNSSIRCGVENVARTVKKIYFLYFICLLASVFIRPGSVTDFFKCLFLTQSYWGSVSTATSFNGNTWFLSSIILCYFFAPMLSKVIIGKKKSNSILLFLGLLLFQFLYGLFLNNYDFEASYYYFYIFPVYRIVDFAEGIAIRNIYNQRHKEYDDLLKPFFLIAMLLFGVELVLIEVAPRALQYDAAWVPLVAIMLMGYASERYLRIHLLGKLGGDKHGVVSKSSISHVNYFEKW